MSDPFTPSPELAAIARRWLVAHGARQISATVNVFSQSAAVTFIGSDENEILTGAGFHDTFKEFSDDHAALVAEDIQATGYESGAFGWVWATLTVVAPEADKSVKFRTSLVFALEDGVWRIVHVHNSIPMTNLDSMGYSSRSLEELSAAARKDRISLGTTGIASVMFTDIVDSTALTAAMGDAAWSRIVTDHVAEVRDAVESAQGTLVKSLGDGTLSSFSSATAAMQAAIAIMRKVCTKTEEPRLSLRIGIHTGDVVESEGDYLGTVVNKAARIAASAPPGNIRVSDATRAMVGSATDLHFTDPVETPLKGLEGAHLLYRLAWQG